MSMQKVDGNSARALFGSTEALMIKSCLENVMGNIYAPSDPPESAAAILGNFCYFGGKADRETVAYRPNSYKDGFIIMIPPDEEWVRTIVEVYGDRAVKMTRYAFKAPEKWDREKLTAFAAALPEGYEMQPIDKELFDVSAASEWACDFVSNYSGYDDYARNGMGIAVLKRRRTYRRRICVRVLLGRYRDRDRHRRRTQAQGDRQSLRGEVDTRL